MRAHHPPIAGVEHLWEPVARSVLHGATRVFKVIPLDHVSRRLRNGLKHFPRWIDMAELVSNLREQLSDDGMEISAVQPEVVEFVGRAINGIVASRHLKSLSDVGD